MSVVMPLLNGAATLAGQLQALTAQTWKGDWEFLAADNGCTDNSLDIVRSFAGRLPAIKLVDAREKRGITRARNAGVARAEGELVLFCDSDDEADPGWIRAMVTAAEKAHIVGGWLETEVLNVPEVQAWRVPADRDQLPTCLDYLPYAIGANFGVWRDAYLEVGGCDEQFVACCDDIDLSWRMQHAGFTIGYAPDAVMHYRYRQSVRDVMRQHWIYGRSEAMLYRKYKHRGAQRQPISRAIRNVAALARRAPAARHDLSRKGQWCAWAAATAGRVVGGIRLGIAYW